MFCFNTSIGRGRGNASFVLGSILILTLFAVSASAQQPAQPTDTTNPDRIQAQEQSRREMNLRNLGAQAEMSKDPRRVQQVAAEIEQDFQSLLTMHNGLARLLIDKKPLDYRFVSDTAAEIRKHATHLRKILALTLSEEELKKQNNTDFEDAQIRDGVATLCYHIKAFVTNPVIENSGIVDAEQLAKARRSLQAVIDFSGSVKKSADRWKNASQ
ncbi:MAG TPA: hypothetical protein VIX17_13620 [Pyrinomonadaceae bacterium]|jgi:hypothetical protein